MAASPLFHGFDGLMSLSRREGVDIRPTLLRVLTDLYVQAAAHSADEKRQFVELTSRLIDEVDEATRAAVRARLAIYPDTPAEILLRLGLKSMDSAPPIRPTSPALPASSSGPPAKPATEMQMHRSANLPLQPTAAGELYEMFFRAGPSERVVILHSLADTPLKPCPKIPPARAARAIETLEMAAFAADVESFTLEVGEALILPARVAAQVVSDVSGEPLACAMRAIDMPSEVFQRVLLFLSPEFGTSVHRVFRLSRLYDRLGERVALVMVSAWREATMGVPRAKHRPGLYDDERQRARPVAAPPPTAQPATLPRVRTGTDGSGR